MKSTIGIIELYHHNEVLIHYCKLFILQNHKLNVFCSSNMFSDLPHELKESELIDWQLNEGDIGNFLEGQKNNISGCDFVLVTTVSSHFNEFLAIPKLSKSAIILHNIHTWLAPFEHINIRPRFIVKDMFRLIRFIVQGQKKARAALLNEFNFIGLPNETILQYTTKHIKTPYIQKLKALPFGGYIGRKKPKSSTQIKFTISGTVENNIRDYKIVLQALSLIRNDIKFPMELVLLGRPKDLSAENIIDSFNSLKINNLKIIHFSNYINEADYQNHLKTTDVLIIPVKSNSHNILFKEVLFKSKLSGTANDLIKYGIPAIVSDCFNIDDYIDSTLAYFSDASSLSKQILRFIDNYKDLDDSIYANHSYEKLYNNLKRNLNF